ncbi:23S rRNA (adenine(2030)-N(6))-methyltransferase RlmJ [Marinospirillum insulare]|uniref:Ribosomal RNA large subunit methyltransferase J n=1 Tax=Marinospirillum insulare TaxID=217169 RepID=A0ABQ5ZXT3_9GAMM|nr:23S rRNA (adenine(2030)-N(6))-methyltransferase RlmJ [Marinospirillum insulare]GLR64974.1 ribosomal RNA large subunit methyltransferase J [Marinospirillum insulare]
MLSYRHSFHAGNFADLLKHLTLSYLLNYLNRKDKPYFYLDTHAGAGLYSLHSPEAEKTAEFREGIERLFLSQPKHPLLKEFKTLISSFNSASRLDFYPGSPAIAAKLMRPTDRLVLHELHPKDNQKLTNNFQKDKRVRIEASDGFAALKAQLPPIERRGLIFIDPSYEVKADYDLLIKAVKNGLERFATGTYAIWYPVLQAQATNAWIKRFQKAGLPNLLRVEHLPLPLTSGRGMTGSGMLIINPPYCLATDFKSLLPELNALLMQGTQGKFLLEELI